MGRIDHTAFEDDTHKIWVQKAIRSDEAFKARMRELGYVSFPEIQNQKLEAMRRALKKKVNARLQREIEAAIAKSVKASGSLDPRWTYMVPAEARIKSTSPRRIMAEVCRKHGITLSDLQGPRRFRPLVNARDECAWRMQKETRLSWPRIGEFMNKDHSSVLLAARRFAMRMEAGE